MDTCKKKKKKNVYLCENVDKQKYVELYQVSKNNV